MGEEERQIAIGIRHLTFRYPRTEKPALSNISLNVRRGELLGIIGPNGGGKSTLLKLLIGMLGGYEGEIEVEGQSPERASRKQLIGYVPQRSEAALEFPVDVRQAVALGACSRIGPLRGVPDAVRRRIDECIDLVGLSNLRRTPVGRLSGGQFQRMLIARALSTNPRILALDEPTVGIDAAGRERFAELVTRLHRREGLTILIVSHDVRAIATGAQHCDRVACLARTLHFHDAPQGLTPQVLAEVFSHELAEAFGEVHIDAHEAAACDHEHHRSQEGGRA